MTFGKRQLMIGALVAALGTAVYLNWQFSGVQPVSVSGADESSSISKQLGQTTYVNTELSGEEAYPSDISDDAEQANAEETVSEAAETAAAASLFWSKGSRPDKNSSKKPNRSARSSAITINPTSERSLSLQRSASASFRTTV